MKLVLYFGDSRAFNCGGIGHDGVEVELVIDHLILNSRSPISLQSLFYLYVKIRVHDLLTKWRYFWHLLW